MALLGREANIPERERRREDKIDEYVLLAYSSQSAERLSGTMGGRESKPVEVLP